MYDNLKTIANICFLFGVYVHYRTVLNRTSSHVKVAGQDQGYISEGQRSLDKVMSYSAAGSEIPSPMSSFTTVNPLDSKGNYSATSNNTKLVHWPLMGGLLHLVQRGGA